MNKLEKKPKHTTMPLKYKKRRSLIVTRIYAQRARQYMGYNPKR